MTWVPTSLVILAAAADLALARTPRRALSAAMPGAVRRSAAHETAATVSARAEP